MRAFVVGKGDVYIADAAANQVVKVARSQADFTFAPQTLGTTGPGQTLTMWSIGNQTLTFQQPAWQGTGDYSSFLATGTATNGCDMTGATPLLAGYGCGIVVTSQPTKAAPLSASQTLLSYAVNTPVTVQLSGTGVGNATSSISIFRRMVVTRFLTAPICR